MTIATLTPAQREDLRILVGLYDTARSGLAAKLNEIIAQWQGEIDEQPAEWHDSEAGVNAERGLGILLDARNELEYLQSELQKLGVK